MNVKKISVPYKGESLDLKAGDLVELNGIIYCGRDAVLPHIVAMAKEGTLAEHGIDIKGAVIFHTAVSPAGVGPTSSNKLEIESSIAPLSAAGVKLHLGKGKLKQETVDALEANNAVYAVIPPVTALLEARTLEKKVLAFPELGMEALHLIRVDRYPAIIGAAHGRSIYE